MKYQINKDNYRNFRTISVNRLSQRSYFIPYPDRDSADKQDALSLRYDSPKVVPLSGEWDFKFYPRPAELPDVLDTDELDFDRIDVPSCWQFRGYCKPFYVNDRYQFPYRPPQIPEEERAGKVFTWFGADYGLGPRWRDPGEEYNYAGVYRTRFSIDDASKRCVLSFLGAASCIDVYVNGAFVGYSEGSHDTAEFDITEHITEGGNELVAVVRRWCTGSYLECQDMFRNTGIFRDVLLRICDETDVFDVDFSTERESSDDRSDGSAAYTASVSAALYGDTEVSFTLSGSSTEIVKKVRSCEKSASVSFRVPDAEEWTAETPVLYDLYVETPGCTVKMKVGFREVSVDGRLFLLNGRKIKLRGVNHHDTSPVNGYAMTPAEIERDARLCKKYNIDTIRTSHYPPDPLLLQLADELGIYVIDEADIETHGTFFHMLPPSYNRISNDPKWAGHFVDRVKALYQRDKNHASVIMWSLGNESGGYYNTDLEYMYLKEVSRLPVQYESAVHSARTAYDVGSEMYPAPSRVHEIGEGKCRVKKLNDRPYFMCEYAHAMGVGPGGAEDYWKEIYAYDALMGGCVWEMNDHAVLERRLADSDHGASKPSGLTYGGGPLTGTDGTDHKNLPVYTYGGDHGEWEHDGNFCVDGLFYPDRSPSSGARNIRFIYRPVRVTHVTGDKYEIFNTMSFTDGSCYLLRLVWSDGCTEELIPEVKPLTREIVEIDTAPHIIRCEEAGIDCLLTITTVSRTSGAELSCEQIALSYAEYEHARTENEDIPSCGGSCTSLKIRDGKPEIEIIGGPGGDPVRICASDPYTILFRAPVDNDFRGGGVKNTMLPFIAETESVLSTEGSDGKIVVRTRIRCKGSSFICTDTYEKAGNDILITSTLDCTRGKGYLPRFGKAFRLEQDFDHVEYYGRNGESYADMKDHTQIGRVSLCVSDMTEPNIRPQESGNRCDTRWASVSDGKRRVTFTACERPYELGVKPYSDRELLGMTHRGDERTTGTYVTISCFQQGLGTGICGPAPSEDVCFPMRRSYTLAFRISFDQDQSLHGRV